MILLCLNPRCGTGDPIRSFLHPWYCGGACELAHKRLLMAGPPRREDVVTIPVESWWRLTVTRPETPSSSPLPAEPVPPGVRVPITPSNSSAVVSAMWGASDAVMVGPQIVSAKPMTRLPRDEVLLEPEPYKSLVPQNRRRVTPAEPGFWERAIKRVFGQRPQETP